MRPVYPENEARGFWASRVAAKTVVCLGTGLKSRSSHTIRTFATVCSGGGVLNVGNEQLRPLFPTHSTFSLKSQTSALPVPVYM